MKKKGRIGEEFEGNGIKDKRIMRRLKMTGKQLSEYPNASIPQACQSIADIKGVYRLFDNKKVTPEGILAGHRAATNARIGKHETVLLVQDTTTLNYNSHPCVEGLGLFSAFPESRGLLLHTTLAVTTKGIPLGIMAQKYWTRSIEERGKKHKRKELSIEEKESNRWLEAMEESTEGISDEVRTVTVADREADIYELFKKSNDMGQNILIRAVGSRQVGSEEKILRDTMEECRSAGKVRIKIPRNANDKKGEREVEFDIKYRTVEIKPPRRRMKKNTVEPIELSVIYAKEIDPLEGEDAIQWLLLTSLPVVSLIDAVEKLTWYKQRWKIERFHFTLKSGCKVENLQLETIDRLENALTLYSIIAWKLIWLTYENRENPEVSCEGVLEKHEWQSLSCMVKQDPNPPSQPPTIKAAVLMIARLGGFMCRKSDGSPGVMVIWRGLQRLNDIASTWLLLHPPTCENVGND